MKKLAFYVVLFALLPFTSRAQGFTTSGGELLDANGNSFVMKGINVPLAWFVNDVNSNIANIRANTNANCLRIVVETSTADIAWQTAVQNCIDNDMIPMVELHDVTGSTSATDLNNMAQFWASKASFLTRPDIARYILINIANEWGTWQTATDDAANPNGGAWLDAFTTAIQTIRNAGITTTLVIDAVGYGQDRFEAQNIRDDAKTMMARDAEFLGGDANLLFSIHMYCEWRIGADDPAIVGTIKNSGIPVIIGEFGFQHATDGSCDIDEQYILNVAQQYGVGWLAWSWKGNSGGVEYLDMSVDWAGTNLTSWGNTIVNGTNGTKTSSTASVFLTTANEPPVISVSSPSLTYVSGSDITLNATASDPDGSISNVQFYSGNTLLGSDDADPYSYIWNDVQPGTYIITAIATDNGGAVTISDEITITVTACPAPDLGNDFILCPGSQATLSSTVATGTGITFSWSKDGQTINGAGENTLHISEAGTYQVTVETSGCQPASDQVSVISGQLTATGEEICAPDQATLTVSGGSGSYEWYESASGGSPLATGSTYSPSVSQTTTFYVADAGLGITETFGETNLNTEVDIWDLGSANFSENDKNVAVTVSQELTLDAVHVYSQTSGNSVTIRILQGTTVVGQATATVGTGKQRIPLGITLQPGSYTMDAAGTAGTLRYQAAGAVFPYSLPDLISFTGTQSWVISEGRYGLFFHWEVSVAGLDPGCERVPVTATHDPDACVMTVTDPAANSFFSYYPNPFTGRLNLEAEGTFAYEISNLSGTILEKGECNDGCNAGAQLPSGVYVLKVKTSSGTSMVKIIRQQGEE